MHINLCRLFNAKAILLEEQLWHYLTHRWEDKGVHTFPKGIFPKVNIIVRLEYELAYYDSAVHRFNHYTTRTPPLNSLILLTLVSIIIVSHSKCLLHIMVLLTVLLFLLHYTYKIVIFSNPSKLLKKSEVDAKCKHEINFHDIFFSINEPFLNIYWFHSFILFIYFISSFYLFIFLIPNL